MASTRMLLGLTVALVIGVSLLPVIVDVAAENTGTVSVVNESAAPPDTVVDLDGYNIDSTTVTVYAENGVEVASANYTLDADPGTINVSTDDPNVGTSASDDEPTVSYDYAASSSTAATVVGLLDLLLALLLFVAIAVAVQGRL